MAYQLAGRVAKNGYDFIEQFHPDAAPAEAFAEIGLIDLVEGVSEVQTLQPKDQAHAGPNTYSGNFGFGRFPLHTDLAHWAIPPRYVVLRNIAQENLVPTMLADGWLVFQSLGEDDLRRALVLPRRPIRGRKQLLRLAERCSNTPLLRVRWDEVFLRPASDRSAEMYESVRRTIQELRPMQQLLTNLGDTLVVDNWRMLHGRGSIPPCAINRRIVRSYLSAIYD